MDVRGYLLDTNIVSALACDPRGSVYGSLQAKLPATVATSIVVAAEIEFGLRKAGSPRLRQRVEAILATIEILPLQVPVADHYGEIRLYLQQIGQPIGQNDLWIAAHGRALGFTVVTGNFREFSRVPDLAVENWLEPIT